MTGDDRICFGDNLDNILLQEKLQGCVGGGGFG